MLGRPGGALPAVKLERGRTGSVGAGRGWSGPDGAGRGVGTLRKSEAVGYAGTSGVPNL